MVLFKYVSGRLRTLHSYRSELYGNIREMDAVIASLNSLTLDNDPHTGAPATAARREEVYDACKREFVRVIRLVNKDYVDQFATDEADDLARENDDD